MEKIIDVKIPVYDPSIGWALGCSRRGYSHIINKTDCQDAFSIWSGSFSGNPCLVVAIADGHGNKKHDLSQYGSAIAVNVAIDEILSFYVNFHLKSESSNIKENFKADYPKRVARRWRENVLSHAKEQGLIDESASNDNQTIYTRYGTTLLIALLSQDLLLLGQIGDGDIVLMDMMGSIESPFEINADQVGSETYSLSMPDAHLFLRTATREITPGVIILATDGLSDSFGGSGNPEFNKFSKSLIQNVTKLNIDELRLNMPVWLDYYSKEGSADDISMGIIGINPSTQCERPESSVSKVVIDNGNNLENTVQEKANESQESIIAETQPLTVNTTNEESSEIKSQNIPGIKSLVNKIFALGKK